MARVFALAAGTAISALLAQCQTPLPAFRRRLPRFRFRSRQRFGRSHEDAKSTPSSNPREFRSTGGSPPKTTATRASPDSSSSSSRANARWRRWQPEPVRGHTTTLGTTQVSDGQVLPFSEVECDAVKEALSYLPAGSNQGETTKALRPRHGARRRARAVSHPRAHDRTRRPRSRQGGRIATGSGLGSGNALSGRGQRSDSEGTRYADKKPGAGRSCRSLPPHTDSRTSPAGRDSPAVRTRH